MESVLQDVNTLIQSMRMNIPKKYHKHIEEAYGAFNIKYTCAKSKCLRGTSQECTIIETDLDLDKIDNEETYCKPQKKIICKLMREDLEKGNI